MQPYNSFTPQLKADKPICLPFQAVNQLKQQGLTLADRYHVQNQIKQKTKADS